GPCQRKTRSSPWNRSGKSVNGRTRTAPRTPWGAVTTPMVIHFGRSRPIAMVSASVDDLEVNALPAARRGRLHHRPQRFSDPPLLPDDLSHIGRRDAELQDDGLLSL